MTDRAWVWLKGKGYWTYDSRAGAWYFGLCERTPPPYLIQRHVEAIIDIASDGSIAGIELLHDFPPPPDATP